MNKRENFSLPESERKIITFEDIIDPEREVPEKYQRLIHLQEQRVDNNTRFNKTGYAANWGPLMDTNGMGKETKFAKQELQYLKDHLMNQALVDLGGGYGFMRHLIRLTGAQMYVNVDRRQSTQNQELNPLQSTKMVDPVDKESALNEVNVYADMLDFVAHLKDGSANFVLNGIDITIINDPAYHKALANELVRATKANGLIFGVGSDALEILHRQIVERSSDLKRHNLPPKLIELMSGIEYYIFEK